jgi:hypothetical protein
MPIREALQAVSLESKILKIVASFVILRRARMRFGGDGHFGPSPRGERIEQHRRSWLTS